MINFLHKTDKSRYNNNNNNNTQLSSVLLEKLTGFQLVKKSPQFMEPESSLP
jgi:hypothetical protein